MPYRYIYEIVNTANGHTYVGQRTSTCLPAVDVYWGSGVLIKRAIQKHGLFLFEKRILEVVLGDKRLLDAREKYWISERKAGGHAEYNISPGGTGGALLEGAPELKALAISRFKASYAARPVSARVATSAQISANVRRHWETMSSADYAAACEKSRAGVLRSYENPEFYKRKCALNAKNGPIQSKTQNSPEWIESTGKNAHTRQNIHVAAGFFMDLDGRLYTRKALVRVLGVSNNAPLAFTANWEKRMTAETHDKWHRRFRWIPNTPENAKTYNFEENVITGCYAQRNKK